MKWTVLSDNRSNDNRLSTEHGLSILLETEKHRILLDTGASDAFIRNAELLGVDLKSVDYVFISHGHSDHAGGLCLPIRQNGKTVGGLSELREYSTSRSSVFLLRYQLVWQRMTLASSPSQPSIPTTS